MRTSVYLDAHQPYTESKLRFGTIRLLESGYNNALFNMAVDEVLMNELEGSTTKSPKEGNYFSDPDKKERVLGEAVSHNSLSDTPSARSANLWMEACGRFDWILSEYGIGGSS